MDRAAMLVVVALISTGCATNQTYIEKKSGELKPLLDSGKYEVAVALTRHDLTLDDSDSNTIRKELAKHSGARAAVLARLQSEIAVARDTASRELLPKTITLASRDGVLSANEAATVRRTLVTRVESLLRSGRISYDLANAGIFEELPEINTPQNQALLFERSLQEIPKASGPRRAVLIERTFKFAGAKAVGSTFDGALKASLDGLGLTTPELKQYVLPYDAMRAQRLLDAKVKRVFLRSEPGDRLLEEDIKDLLAKRDEDLSFVPSTGPDVLTITIGKLQYEERADPERKQTYTYQQHEVNLLGAVLLMPRNASYMYEHVSGGIDVSAAFLVKITNGTNTLVDKVMRERASRRYSHCENERIVNVFGGIQKAQFVANDDMANRCNTSSSARPDPTEVRNEIFSRVADEIASRIRK